MKNIIAKKNRSDNEISNKSMVLGYLKSKKPCAAAACYVEDEIYDFETNIPLIEYDDGEFYWNTEDIYHFEKYNFILDKDFLKKIN